LAVNPPKSFVGSLPPFTVAEKRAARQRRIGMLLAIQKSYELLANFGFFARQICDKCGTVLGAVRFTRHNESKVYCCRECRGDAQRSATHRWGRPRKYKTERERRAAKSRQQQTSSSSSKYSRNTGRLASPSSQKSLTGSGGTQGMLTMRVVI
jgi:hypothetical protein